MKVRIEEGCIGCGLCIDVCPEVFRLNDEGLSEVYEQPKSENQDSAQEAADGCPVTVIITES